MKRITTCTVFCTASLLLTLTACQKDFNSAERTEFSAAPSASFKNVKNNLDIPFYLLTDNNRLEKYTTARPENALNSVAITGLQSGESILAIDFRPATGQLYGLGSTSRLYVINPETGAARAIGSGPFTPALSGDAIGFDFNPTVDRIRLVSSTGQNLRLNPETGAVAAEDGPINGVPGAMVTSVAYTSNFAGATTTTLYDIDVTTDKLYKQVPPNNGTLVEVGDLGMKLEGNGGFDIAPMDDVALAIYEVNKKPTLFAVDLATGKTKTITKYNKDAMYTGIAIPTDPVAYASTASNMLLIFNPANPSMVISKNITGLQAGETLLGIDFRPLNGQLFGLGSSSRLYAINTSSGAATSIGSGLSIPLNGTQFGFDFNPLVDRIRIVSNSGQNLRVNPMDATAAQDGMLNPGMPSVTAAAYTNNFAGTTATQLLVIDTGTDKLYLQNPPNNGTLMERGSLGIDADGMNGFDIGGTSGNAWALLTAGGATRLYAINLTTGAATARGNFTSGVTGFSIGLGF